MNRGFITIFIYVAQALLFAAAAVWYWIDWRRDSLVLLGPVIAISAIVIYMARGELAGKHSPSSLVALAGLVGVFGFIGVLAIGVHGSGIIALYTLLFQLIALTIALFRRLRTPRAKVPTA